MKNVLSALILVLVLIFLNLAISEEEVKFANKNKVVPTTTSISPVVNRTISEEELVSAINTYRIAHGLNSLVLNNSLCVETRKRVKDVSLENKNKYAADYILSHNGMVQDIQQGVLYNLVGKSRYGENIASAYCRKPSDNQELNISNAAELMDCFDSSREHKENLLRPDWTDVCSSGEFPFYVQMFAR